MSGIRGLALMAYAAAACSAFAATTLWAIGFLAG
jgi:hypothetical protein